MKQLLFFLAAAMNILDEYFLRKPGKKTRSADYQHLISADIFSQSGFAALSGPGNKNHGFSGKQGGEYFFVYSTVGHAGYFTLYPKKVKTFLG